MVYSSSVMSRRSEKHRADKYKQRAAAMLDQFQWQRDEEYFLGLMESGALTLPEIRELHWSQIQDRYEGLAVMERPLVVRQELLEGVKEMLRNETGLYGESFAGQAASSRVFTKETLKSISRELDQFKGV